MHTSWYRCENKKVVDSNNMKNVQKSAQESLACEM